MSVSVITKLAADECLSLGISGIVEFNRAGVCPTTFNLIPVNRKTILGSSTSRPTISSSFGCFVCRQIENPYT